MRSAVGGATVRFSTAAMKERRDSDPLRSLEKPYKSLQKQNKIWSHDGKNGADLASPTVESTEM